MTRDEFVMFLQKVKVPYEIVEGIEGYDGVYVYSRKEFNEKKAHPRKNKNLFVPYLRVSDFGTNRVYVRDCGLCEYRSLSNVIGQVTRMAA